MGTNQGKSTAVPKLPEYSERPCGTNQRKSTAVPERLENSERPWEKISGKALMCLAGSIIEISVYGIGHLGLWEGDLAYDLFFIAQYS